MADPISIISGLTTVVATVWSLGKQLCDLIEGMKNAPRNIENITGELKGLHVVLGVLHGLLPQLDANKNTPDLVPIFEVLQSNLDDCCHDLQDLFEKLAQYSNPSGETNVKKRSWAAFRWQFKEKEIKELRDHLAAYKMTVNVALATANLVNHAQTLDANKNIEIEIRKMRVHLGGLGLIDGDVIDCVDSAAGDAGSDGSHVTDRDCNLRRFLATAESRFSASPCGSGTPEKGVIVDDAISSSLLSLIHDGPQHPQKHRMHGSDIDAVSRRLNYGESDDEKVNNISIIVNESVNKSTNITRKRNREATEAQLCSLLPGFDDDFEGSCPDNPFRDNIVTTCSNMLTFGNTHHPTSPSTHRPKLQKTLRQAYQEKEPQHATSNLQRAQEVISPGYTRRDLISLEHQSIATKQCSNLTSCSLETFPTTENEITPTLGHYFISADMSVPDTPRNNTNMDMLCRLNWATDESMHASRDSQEQYDDVTDILVDGMSRMDIDTPIEREGDSSILFQTVQDFEHLGSWTTSLKQELPLQPIEGSEISFESQNHKDLASYHRNSHAAPETITSAIKYKGSSKIDTQVFPQSDFIPQCPFRSATSSPRAKRPTSLPSEVIENPQSPFRTVLGHSYFQLPSKSGIYNEASLNTVPEHSDTKDEHLYGHLKAEHSRDIYEEIYHTTKPCFARQGLDNHGQWMKEGMGGQQAIGGGLLYGLAIEQHPQGPKVDSITDEENILEPILQQKSHDHRISELFTTFGLVQTRPPTSKTWSTNERQRGQDSSSIQPNANTTNTRTVEKWVNEVSRAKGHWATLTRRAKRRQRSRSAESHSTPSRQSSIGSEYSWRQNPTSRKRGRRMSTSPRRRSPPISQRRRSLSSGGVSCTAQSEHTFPLLPTIENSQAKEPSTKERRRPSDRVRTGPSLIEPALVPVWTDVETKSTPVRNHPFQNDHKALHSRSVNFAPAKQGNTGVNRVTKLRQEKSTVVFLPDQEMSDSVVELS